jgi:hypothetical protein
MGRQITLPEILEAINGSNGIKVAIARKLGVHRNSVNNYLKRYASAQQAYDDEVEKIGDLAESVIFGAIEAGDVDTAQWYCRVKLKARGYGEQVRGTPEAPIVFTLKLTEDD